MVTVCKMKKFLIRHLVRFLGGFSIVFTIFFAMSCFAKLIYLLFVTPFNQPFICGALIVISYIIGYILTIQEKN